MRWAFGIFLLLGFPALASPGSVAHYGYCDENDYNCFTWCELEHETTDPPHWCFSNTICEPQPIHYYVLWSDVRFGSTVLMGGDDSGAGFVTVMDTNTRNCNSGIAAWDGDPDLGIGGGFFGHGPWARDPLCGYDLNPHAGHVTVMDAVFGSNVQFVMGANDMSGPIITTDPATGETVCSTDGSITPGDPATDPTADPDDCLTPVYRGDGTTCGAGGDGGYWVFIIGPYAREDGTSTLVEASAMAGTITADF